MRGRLLLNNLCRNYNGKPSARQSTLFLSIRACTTDYANQYGFSKKDLKEFNFVNHILKPWAVSNPDHCALWLYDGNKSTKLSYSEILSTGQYLANSLHHIGSPKCAVVVLPKIFPWWSINISGSFTGMIIAPGTTMLTEKEIFYRLESCNADSIFCSPDLMHRYDAVTKTLAYRIVVGDTEEDEVSNIRNGWLSYHKLIEKGKTLQNIKPINDGDAIAQLFFTSGTTGKPKMVPHTQVGYGIGHQECARRIMALEPSDVFWNMADLGWAKSAYSSLYLPLIAGCTIFVHQIPRFDPKIVIQTLIEHPITALCCPPTALRSIIQEDISEIQSSRLKRIFCAGEPLNAEVTDTWNARTGIPIYEMYGQTEMTVMAANVPGVIQKSGSMGKATNTYDVVILDDNLNELGDDEPGQIAISLKTKHPYGLFKEYYNNQDKTNKAFSNGYYLTGDKAFRDKDGYLWYVGRSDDIIISAGYRIGPFEVESALIEHPAVKESAVVASPDPSRGHVVKAYIILTDQYASRGANEESSQILKKEIQEYIKQNIAPYKYPRKIEFIESLPKTVSGKIRRIELRERE